MARVIIMDGHGPQEVKIGDQSKWICRCGLSKNQPFCDGSHKKTLDEDKTKTYRYNEDGTRVEV